jgi:hypothetical protein
MSRALTRTWPFPTGLLLALLALVSQLALGTMVLPDDSAVPQLDAISILCQTGAPDQPQPATPHHQHVPDCAICPLCVALAVPGVILTPAPMLPLPPSIRHVAQIALPPPSRGPPSRPLHISPSRGPPVLT